MASSLVVEDPSRDPSISNISARPTGQIKLQGPWKSRNFRPILRRGGFYFFLLPLQLYHRLYIHFPGIAYRAISKEQSALYQSTPFLCRVSIALVGEGSHIGRAVPF